MSGFIIPPTIDIGKNQTQARNAMDGAVCVRDLTHRTDRRSLHTLKPLPSPSSTLGATLPTINSGIILAEFDAYVVSEMLRRLERRRNAQAGNRSTLKTDHILQKRSVFKEGLHLLRQQQCHASEKATCRTSPAVFQSDTLISFSTGAWETEHLGSLVISNNPFVDQSSDRVERASPHVIYLGTRARKI